MPLYAHVFLARQDISTQQVEAPTTEYTAVIEAGGGKVAKSEYWGLRSLAYKIKKSRKAHYTLFNIDAPPAAVAEMERLMGISTDQCIAVGDGANDLPMMMAAGLSIAYHPKPAVLEKALVSITQGGLDRALQILR